MNPTCSLSDLLDISTTELPGIGDPGITCVIGRFRIYLDFGCCDGSVLWEVTKQRNRVGSGETRDTMEAFEQCVGCIKANAKHEGQA